MKKRLALIVFIAALCASSLAVIVH